MVVDIALYCYSKYALTYVVCRC